MASSQVATTCTEPNTVPAAIPSLLLERLFIAAISALGSVTVTLGIIKWRVRKNRREAEHISDEEESDGEDSVALEKQLAWSEHRMRELEALVDKAASKQAEAEEKLQKARNAAAAGQERSREAARHAAESREKVHRLESVQSNLLAEREQLLREAEQARSAQAATQAKLGKAEEAASSAAQKLKVHSEERRGLDRRIKDLEIRLSGALSSKSLSDEEHAQRAQELQQQAASASKAQHAAEADLARVKSKGADIQRKVEAASLSVGSMRRELEARERRCGELEALLRQQQEARASLEGQLAGSRQRVKELQVQLQMSQEALSKSEERLRAAARERQGSVEGRSRR
ncbi:hypothetical protein CVIRNUC_009153 [Coccomyxa viridis]|uniref:Uncharacterized protein n=1 Tax=Coccomyxa viridis TaxID=1274662 RepID=A0AAV1II98_9CHLO|nr:hypothetical protein CVIRNUC_009153 [Coccomyxa viridis]